MPEHLEEPLRREIAVSYVQHEIRKLLPSVRDETIWQGIDKDIANWHQTLGPENFWNGVHGISMGFRLKSLVPWITSKHVRWKKEEVPLDTLWFGGTFGPVKNLGVEPSAKAVMESIFLPEHTTILERTRQVLENADAESASRNQFPIFAVQKDDKLTVIDGNRRLVRAILQREATLPTFVGEPSAQPALFEYWLPTSLLVDLVFWHKHNLKAGRDTTEETACVIADLIRNTSYGRKEFEERAIHSNDEIHQRLKGVVDELLSKEINI